MKSATTTASNCAAGIRLGMSTWDSTAATRCARAAWDSESRRSHRASLFVELPVELVKEIVDFVEKELGRRRDLSRGIHGTKNLESMALVPIISNRLLERGEQ